jgi:hypothetical protein
MIRFRAYRSARGRLLCGLWWGAVSLPPGELIRRVMISHGEPPLGFVLVLAALLFGVWWARVPVLAQRATRLRG